MSVLLAESDVSQEASVTVRVGECNRTREERRRVTVEGRRGAEEGYKVRLIGVWEMRTTRVAREMKGGGGRGKEDSYQRKIRRSVLIDIRETQ